MKLYNCLLSGSVSVESLTSSESENELKQSNNLNTNIEKGHNFVQKIIVIPETCGQCQKRFVKIQKTFYFFHK